MSAGLPSSPTGRDRRRATREVARRAGLPTAGTLTGRITIVQEDRFRMEDAEGRGYLLILGRSSGVSMQDLHEWREGCSPVCVEFHGAPDLGAVATRVRLAR